MKNELLSVIVPIYNVEPYLKECVDSIIASQYQNLEIILVDDGSPDNCGQICDEYAEKDNRIKVVHKENGGLISARKAGIEVATGYYITFVDGDDKVYSDYYQKAFEAMEELPDAMVLGITKELSGERIELWHSKYDSGYYNNPEKLKEITAGLLLNSDGVYMTLHAVCSMFVKADIFKSILNLVDNKVTIYEDAIFSLCCLSKVKSVRILNENVGYFYRNTEGSMLKGKSKDLFPARKIYAANLISLLPVMPEILNEQVVSTDLFRVGIKQMMDYKKGSMFNTKKEYRQALRELIKGDNPISENLRTYPVKNAKLKPRRRLYVYLMRLGIYC